VRGGAGIAGCSTALHLALAGLRVVLLEEHRVGWGASGQWRAGDLRNRRGQTKLERLIGAEAARAVWDVSVEGLALMRELIARFSIDCDWARGTWPPPSRSATERELHAELRATARPVGYASVRYMPREELRATLATERLPRALYDTNSGPSAPPQLHAGTRGGGRGPGRAHLRGNPRHGFAPAGASQVRVQTPAGEVRARHLALCGNVYLGATARHSPQDHGGCNLHRGDRTVGCGARATVDRQQRGGQRHELGAGLLPAVSDHVCCSAGV